jgi:hypothetical protein
VNIDLPPLPQADARSVSSCASKEANSSSSALMVVGLGMRLGRRIGLENSDDHDAISHYLEIVITLFAGRA